MKKFFEEFFNDSAIQPLNPSNNFDPIALCTYPGYLTLPILPINHFSVDYYLIRYILESITGIPTGSDLKEDSPNINVSFFVTNKIILR